MLLVTTALQLVSRIDCLGDFILGNAQYLKVAAKRVRVPTVDYVSVGVPVARREIKNLRLGVPLSHRCVGEISTMPSHG